MLKKCSKCSKQILESTICHHNSDYYHSRCCFICGEMNKEKKDHKALFNCKLCNLLLYDNDLFNFYHNNPYCMDCYTKNFCKTCNSCLKFIEPCQVEFEFGNDHFHNNCFLCCNCDKKLYEHYDEKIYRDGITGKPCCSRCYNKLYRKICSKCNEIINADQTGISYSTKAFHRECFMCFKCNKNLYDKFTGKRMKFFKGHNDYPICEDCFEKCFCKMCIQCSKSIYPSEKSIRFENKLYHRDCFVCHNCQISLAASSQHPFLVNVYKGQENKPLCADCYSKSNCKKCFKCSKYILPDQERIDFDHKIYHKECLCCCNCNAHLDADVCTKDHKDRPICFKCYSKLYCKKCKKCSEFILPEQNSINFENKYDYHKDCFCCFKCDKKLSARSDHVKCDYTLYFKNEQDLPICSECYEKFYCDKCEKCNGPIKPNQNKLIHQNKSYHSQCFVCSKCTTKIVDVETCKTDANNHILCQKCWKTKEKSPPKAKAGPGKLNFGQISSFEKKTDFDCIKCKKKIVGQKFLTHKVGEFLCKSCKEKNESSCFLCSKIFESGEEFFKDEANHNYCAKCIKIYKQNKKN